MEILQRFFGTIVALFLGMLTTCGVVILATVLTACTGYYLQSFGLCFVVPLGGLLAGAFCVVGYPWGLRLFDLRARFLDYVATIGMSMVCFCCIYGSLYATAFVDADMKVNHVFRGEHISNYEITETHTPITFWTYLADDVSSRESSFMYGVGGRRWRVITPPSKPHSMGSEYNWAKFLLEAIGFAIGAVISTAHVSQKASAMVTKGADRVAKSNLRNRPRCITISRTEIVAECNVCLQKFRIPRLNGKVIQAECPICKAQFRSNPTLLSSRLFSWAFLRFVPRKPG